MQDNPTPKALKLLTICLSALHIPEIQSLSEKPHSQGLQTWASANSKQLHHMYQQLNHMYRLFQLQALSLHHSFQVLPTDQDQLFLTSSFHLHLVSRTMMCSDSWKLKLGGKQKPLDNKLRLPNSCQPTWPPS